MKGTFIFTWEIPLWFINDNGEKKEESDIKTFVYSSEYYIETFLGFLKSHHYAI